MEEDVLKKIAEQDQKLEKIWKSVEKTRKYFLWTLIATVVTFVLPLVIFTFLIPKVLSVYMGSGLNF